jgi:hypothetical protein
MERLYASIGSSQQTQAQLHNYYFQQILTIQEMKLPTETCLNYSQFYMKCLEVGT